MQTVVETLDEGVLHGFTRSDAVPLDLRLLQPAYPHVFAVPMTPGYGSTFMATLPAAKSHAEGHQWFRQLGPERPTD